MKVLSDYRDKTSRQQFPEQSIEDYLDDIIWDCLKSCQCIELIWQTELWQQMEKEWKKRGVYNV